MAANVTDADAYIALNCIVIEDWTDADAASKQRLLNVAGRTLAVKYPQYTIPDNAVYEFANVLATAFNDVNKYGQQGIQVAQFNGIGSFNYALTAKPGDDVSKLIPQSALDIIGAENGVNLAKRRVGWVVL